ncbi:MAG: hypothetical protein IE936_09500, partial [Moraxella osloensis]|nr:hypothetical protein [Moraxella osloensis]
PKPLKLSTEGLSFLLQSGVVPPPKTAYQDIYILGIGDMARVSTVNGKIDIQFSHEFPFLNAKRLHADEMQPDEDLILQMLAEATISRIDESKPSFLFHSAGKDSNSIALALAEAGWQDKVTLITHKSKGQADESEISTKIAKQLGFKHQILHEVDQLQAEHKQAINDYFVNAPFPCTDNVTLAYPLYAHQLPELKGANIIDGMGNDVFIGHIPSRSEYKRQQLSKYLKHSRILSKHFPSESLFHVAGRTRAEWTGLSGLSFSDAKKILPAAFDVSDFWLEKDTDQDYLDFRPSIRGTIIDQEIFTRKARNFADSINANMVLPWANQQVAEYFAKMPEQHLFDRKALKNKLILRKILKDRIALDSDALGKLGFTYDAHAVVSHNLDTMKNEIQACSIWDANGLGAVLSRFINQADHLSRAGSISRSFIYRLYLISAWYNQNQYVN